MPLPMFLQIRDWTLEDRYDQIETILADTDPNELVGLWNSVVSIFSLFNPLGIGIHDNLSKLVATFVSAGMDFDEKDEKGNTPLMHALSSDLDISCRVLLNAGAPINTCDYESSPLAEAVREKNVSRIEKLLFNGAIYGGTEYGWDAGLFNDAIQKSDHERMDYYLYEFEKLKRPNPQVTAMKLSLELEATKFIDETLRRDYERERPSKQPVCLFVWSVRWAQVDGIQPHLDQVICTMFEKRQVKRPTRPRSIPDLLIALYTWLHDTPATLEMEAAAAIINSLGTKTPKKMEAALRRLPLPESMKEAIHKWNSINTLLQDKETFHRTLNLNQLPNIVKIYLRSRNEKITFAG